MVLGVLGVKSVFFIEVLTCKAGVTGSRREVGRNQARARRALANVHFLMHTHEILSNFFTCLIEEKHNVLKGISFFEWCGICLKIIFPERL